MGSHYCIAFTSTWIYIPIPLASINSLTPFSPISGNILTITHSRILYARCLFMYVSLHTSISDSTSLTTSVCDRPAARASIVGRSAESASAQFFFISVCCSGVGGSGAGGGSAFRGKRFVLIVDRRVGSREGLRIWFVRR